MLSSACLTHPPRPDVQTGRGNCKTCRHPVVRCPTPTQMDVWGSKTWADCTFHPRWMEWFVIAMIPNPNPLPTSLLPQLLLLRNKHAHKLESTAHIA